MQLTQRDAPRHFQSWFETFEYVEVFYSSKDFFLNIDILKISYIWMLLLLFEERRERKSDREI